MDVDVPVFVIAVATGEAGARCLGRVSASRAGLDQIAVCRKSLSRTARVPATRLDMEPIAQAHATCSPREDAIRVHELCVMNQCTCFVGILEVLINILCLETADFIWHADFRIFSYIYTLIHALKCALICQEQLC